MQTAAAVAYERNLNVIQPDKKVPVNLPKLVCILELV